ncbi:MAG: hypothetical protein VX772_03655 [Bacteroidota bacterium]|uniref:Sulfur reduction protein DsrE n=1 Tax=Flagellimonas okinawensis TaxID=3031324 RepID=A0ABT5XJH8_9FLAO|nr:hypothetical protein [[Muricauda] okinawensis]MDF0706039.1 hypothetical protein [[Muricauda] okinawensis]MEC8831431.1 hypothetical protein [Bacteroidota bacterium]
MKKQILFLFTSLVVISSYCQTTENNTSKDSVTSKEAPVDSEKRGQVNRRQQMMAKIEAVATFPVINAGTFSGVVPIEDITETPDPNLEYKLLFELVNFDDEKPSDLNAGLVEVARIINLHAASGIPLEKTYPVIVVHAAALNSFTTNEFYNGKFEMDNPNMKLIEELENLGAKFISCGQAMFFFEVDKEALLPMFKISLTAQTILSSYQMKGYVKYRINR